jgi:hypothetical protein
MVKKKNKVQIIFFIYFTICTTIVFFVDFCEYFDLFKLAMENMIIDPHYVT